jgi:putative DNA primase/helicase
MGYESPQGFPDDLSDLLGDLATTVPATPRDNAAVALDLAARGFRVFPIYNRRTKDDDWRAPDRWTPNTGWQEAASADAAQVAAWWLKAPDARVGLLTGPENGITVLDIDMKNGHDGLASLAKLGFDLSASPVRVRTPSGGWHLFFAYDPECGDSRSVIGDGLDTKGHANGSYVVAPGSFKGEGRYEPEGAPLGSVMLPTYPAALRPPRKESRDREPMEVVADPADFQIDWAARRLAKWAEELAATPEGRREETLNAAVLWAGGAAAHGFLTKAEAEEALLTAALECALPEREIRPKFKERGAWGDGLRKPLSDFPRVVEVSADDFDDVPALEVDEAPSEWSIAAFDADGEPDLSHDQLALDLGKAGFDRDARYCAPLGGWLLWRGQHWEAEPGQRPLAIVRGFLRTKARLLVEWAEARAKTLDLVEGEKLVAWAKAQAKALRHDANITAVERLARSNVNSLAQPDQWDRDDFLLGTPGGTIDLRTGELRAARRGDYITRQTSVEPTGPGSRPAAWLKFLAEVFPGDPEMVALMQRLAGYALTGSTREHRLFLFHGSGRNGKGTLLGTLQTILGDYAKGIPTSTLLEARSPQHKAPLARLRGARFVRGAELPVGQVWDESLVKMLTGGDSIPVNHMRGETFDLQPKFTLVVDANTKPRIRTTDVAMRARMTLIPFGVSFAGREDRGLAERLLAEAPAILRWAIEGAVEWQRGGLRIPESALAASREYMDSEDSLAHFLEDETVPAPGTRLAAAAVYARYRTWATEQGVTPATLRAFGGMLTERGIERDRAASARGYVGLRLRDGYGPADLMEDLL